MPFEGFPIVIGLELTLACNLQCKHCASAATKRTRLNELTLQEIFTLCDQFPDLFVQEVDLTGGEPLLHPEWQKVTEHLSKLGIDTRMVTNGILLKENAEKLADSGIKTVGVSLDGLEETHDYIRKKTGLFNRVVSGIETAISKGVPIAIITAVNDINIAQLAALQSLLCELGIKHWQLQPIFSLGRASSEAITLSAKTYLEMGKYIWDLKTCCKNPAISIMPADGVGYFTGLDTRERSWKGCPAGISSCGITSDGHVKGCLSLPDNFYEGNLRQKDLWSIWFDDNSFAFNRQFSKPDLNGNCKDCNYGTQCKGGCLVMSYSATGQLHNNPYCFHRLIDNGTTAAPVTIHASHNT